MLGITLGDFGRLFCLNLNSNMPIKGFAVDSRKVESGFVFFALQGNKTDGHNYIEVAIKNGAIACVVSKQFEFSSSDALIIRVEDPLVALQSLARDFLSKQNKKIVAITGSVGKTTTKEFCYTLLSSKYKVFKTPGNANSQIGLPLSVLNHGNFEEDILIFEMGMSSYGQIEVLVQIAPPDLAVITRIAPAHIEHFEKGLEGIAEAKMEILSSDKTQHAVINEQVETFDVFKKNKGKNFIRYSTLESSSADFKLKKDKGFVRVENQNTFYDLSPNFEESHFLENLLAAIAVARFFNVSWNQIGEAVKKLHFLEKRFERIIRNEVTFINDSYNANPDSMKAALANLPKPSLGAKSIAILGHMVELGSLSEIYHEEVGRFASTYVDILICYGDKSLPIKEGFDLSGKPSRFFNCLSELNQFLKKELQPGDVVLIKASNSVSLWKLMDV
ncbi:MAG: UDP-N-acetylmuramoyl-tripeptide--D-alanyl-D-alanine ligase [Chlamydiae bacterium]|nr:UDP-N-acetylmuramoyl-tripeptide--D-alanyl-D-alanine ligase [Chlamydiota bacterium]